jgi:hypothetical protein
VKLKIPVRLETNPFPYFTASGTGTGTVTSAVKASFAY